MDNRHDKDEMTTLVDVAFKENNIQPKYTRLGKDVIFRKARWTSGQGGNTVAFSHSATHFYCVYTLLTKVPLYLQGDPCLQHDLVRVAAHKATSVLIMMTQTDFEGKEESGGATSNSATIRTCLALRNGLGL